MALATATPDGPPSVRMVLLKEHGPDGFVFYTNAESRKGGEIRANPPRGAAVPLEVARTGRCGIEGPLEEVGAEMADAYFASRHPDSRLGSAASDQSRPLDFRETYLARVEALRAAPSGGEVPRPPHWTGFRLVPERIEFWLGRPHRLHEQPPFVQPVRPVLPESIRSGSGESRSSAAGAPPRLAERARAPRSAQGRSRAHRAGATGRKRPRRAANRVRAWRNRHRPSPRATRSSGPSMRTCRRSDFQWNSSAACGLARISSPLRLSALV